mgnify:CR=1 FL=1
MKSISSDTICVTLVSKDLTSLIRLKFPGGEFNKLCHKFVIEKPVYLSIYDWDQKLIDYKYIIPVYGKVQGGTFYTPYGILVHLRPKASNNTYLLLYPLLLYLLLLYPLLFIFEPC